MVYILPMVLISGKGLDAERQLKAENDLRSVLVQAIGGSIVLWGTFRTLHLNREGQITERFTRAIDQLGQSDDHKLDIRLGGIYALERIARDSTSDRVPIIEVLTAFLREHARWRPDGQEATSNASREPDPGSSTSPRLRADFQAAATVLARNNWAAMWHRFDLSEVDLHEVDLTGAHLECTFLFGIHLERANLFLAHLEGADLRDAHLEGAYLFCASLRDAHLSDAHLERADLRSAHLEGVNLCGAYLEGVDLSGAHLEGTSGLEEP